MAVDNKQAFNTLPWTGDPSMHLLAGGRRTGGGARASTHPSLPPPSSEAIPGPPTPTIRRAGSGAGGWFITEMG